MRSQDCVLCLLTLCWTTSNQIIKDNLLVVTLLNLFLVSCLPSVVQSMEVPLIHQTWVNQIKQLKVHVYKPQLIIKVLVKAAWADLVSVLVLQILAQWSQLWMENTWMQRTCNKTIWEVTRHQNHYGNELELVVWSIYCNEYFLNIWKMVSKIENWAGIGTNLIITFKLINTNYKFLVKY